MKVDAQINRGSSVFGCCKIGNRVENFTENPLEFFLQKISKTDSVNEYRRENRSCESDRTVRYDADMLSIPET